MKRHPYILATTIATLLAIVVWLCVPNEYTAYTKLSDEYKETELAIGFSSIKAHIKNAMGGANTGMNDMEIYCKVLKTEDFASDIARKRMSGKDMTYGQYLGKVDTVQAVLDRINYNYSSRETTLRISFTDKDPLVASQMLDSITVQLQTIITRHRHIIVDSAMHNAMRALSATQEKYQRTMAEYGRFIDSHASINTSNLQEQEKALEKELKDTYALHEKAVEEYARQKALRERAYLSFAVIQDNTVPQHSDKYLMSYLLSFIFLAWILTYALLRSKNGRLRDLKLSQLGGYFSPWFLTIAIWTLILGLYYLLDTDLYPITKQFYYCFLLWVPIFCICSIGAYVLSAEGDDNSIRVSSIDFNKTLFTFFFIISLIITPLYVYRVIQIVTMFGTEDLMTNVRTLAIYGEGQGILNYSVVINQALFVVALWAHPRIPTWQVVILGLACLMNSLAIMEKGTMFFVFVSSMFVLFEKKVIRIRSILTFGILVILLFYLFNLGRAGEDSDYQKEETLLDFFTMYALSPPVAFCQLSPEAISQFGTNTFETVYLFLKRLGADVVVKDKLQEFVFVPVNTNVYTVFQPFYIDFGYRGVAIFAAVYGCVCGYIYRLFRNGSGVGTCLHTYAVYVLLLQFYQENVFLSLVFVLQFTFFVILFTQQKFRLQLSPLRL